MLGRKYLLKSAAIIIVAYFTLMSCDNNTSFLGLDFVKDGEIGASTGLVDTLSFSINNTVFDSVSTSYPSYGIVGSITDPDFGKTTAYFATEIPPIVVAYEMGENPICDSVYISFKTYPVQGNDELEYTLHFMQIAKGDSIGSFPEIYNSTSKDRFLQNATEFMPPVTINTIGHNDNDDYDSIYKVYIERSIGQSFLNEDDTTYRTPTEWRKDFPGLFIYAEVSDPNNSSLCMIDDIDISVFFHNDTDTVPFRMKSERGANGIMYDREYNGSKINQSINGSSDEFIYLHGTTGLLGEITFPDISSIYKESRQIAKAELEFYVPEYYSHDSYFTNQNYINLYTLNPDTTATHFKMTIDEARYYSAQVQGSFGGFLNEHHNRFKFNITSHLNKILHDDIEKPELYLMLSNAMYNNNGLVLGGNGHATMQPKLIIHYIDL